MESVAVMVNAADLKKDSTYKLGSTIKFQVLSNILSSKTMNGITFYNYLIKYIHKEQMNKIEEETFTSEQEFQEITSGGRRRKSRKARRAQKKRTRRSRR